eukprot:TRINITY_DN6457_c0_g1_i3.p1 TRINITY_DN6457_c0_g1~~TRINITY_DN6457_c0_g1_i3.p1  ORF type:complete len:199 (-),score=57.66 TRINITY_DN6457_c0_g1_i3:35-631(-)
MIRDLKFHESKLLKKTNFFEWKSENNLHEIKVVRRYHLQDREDYTRYNKLCGVVTKMVNKLKQLKQDDLFRIKMTEQLLEKLYNLGLTNNKNGLQQCEKLGVFSFCRRRLATVLQRLKYTETIKEAVTFIEQGHIRIGTEVVTDPSLLVTRNMEDHIAWVDTSAIRKKIMKYHDKLDDYDMLESVSYTHLTLPTIYSV